MIARLIFSALISLPFMYYMLWLLRSPAPAFASFEPLWAYLCELFVWGGLSILLTLSLSAAMKDVQTEAS